MARVIVTQKKGGLGLDEVKDYHIDWGHSGDQVDAQDIPYDSTALTNVSSVHEAIDALASQIGSGGTLFSENPSGTIDGFNKNFTTSFDYISGTLMVFLNGLRESNITETGLDSFSFSTAPASGSNIVVTYQR